MGKNITRVVVVFAILTVSLLSVWQLRTSRRTPGQLESLPKFSVPDISGNSVSSANLVGKSIFLQFVNPAHNSDIELFNRVYDNWGRERLTIIVVTDKPKHLLERLKARSNGIIIISENTRVLTNAFGVIPPNLKYFFFDQAGKLAESGENYIDYERSLKIQLLRVIENTVFNVKDLLVLGQSICEVPGFNSLGDVVRKERKEYYLISLFTSFCDSCISGHTIHMMNDIIGAKGGRIYAMAILSADYYRSGDLDSIRSQSQINFPLAIADRSMNFRWSLLIHQFNKYELNNISFILDDTGKIIKINYPGCSCGEDFYRFLAKILRKEETGN